MKQVVALPGTLFFLLQVTWSQAWVSPSSLRDQHRSDSTQLHMGSKAANKAIKKRVWLERRGGTMTSESDQDASSIPAFAEIIGSGRIGSLLAQAGNCAVRGRQDSIDPNGSGPILIATRNDALEGIVENCPENRRKDLVFMQNGYLDDFLASKGLSDNTQVLLYLSVTAKGATPIDGDTIVNPEGLTAAAGIHAQAFADRVQALQLKCRVVSDQEYRPAMFEKLIWISTYMLVGTAKKCSSVGQAGSEYKGLVEQVVNELLAATSAKEGIAFPDGTMERLAAYTDKVADFPCAVKEFEWRNKYFYDLGDQACPTHNQLLRECQEHGFLGFDLP